MTDAEFIPVETMSKEELLSLVDGEIGRIESYRYIENRPRQINQLVYEMMFEAVWWYKNQEDISFRTGQELGAAYDQVLEDRVKAHIKLGRWLSTGIWMP